MLLKKKTKQELIINNSKACYDGYLGGLTVEWMASMSNQSKSTIYRYIKNYKKYLENEK